MIKLEITIKKTMTLEDDAYPSDMTLEQIEQHEVESLGEALVNDYLVDPEITVKATKL